MADSNYWSVSHQYLRLGPDCVSAIECLNVALEPRKTTKTDQPSFLPLPSVHRWLNRLCSLLWLVLCRFELSSYVWLPPTFVFRQQHYLTCVHRCLRLFIVVPHRIHCLPLFLLLAVDLGSAHLFNLHAAPILDLFAITSKYTGVMNRKLFFSWCVAFGSGSLLITKSISAWSFHSGFWQTISTITDAKHSCSWRFSSLFICSSIIWRICFYINS